MAVSSAGRGVRSFVGSRVPPTKESPMKSLLAVLAVLLLAPAAASAMPIDGPVLSGSRGAPPARGTNVAAPDQQSPKAFVVPVQVRGTNVAASDQQAPKALVAPPRVGGTNVAASDQRAPNPAPAPVPAAAAAPGFDWGTAAIGAAPSLLLMTALFGIAVTLRRRHSVISG